MNKIYLAGDHAGFNLKNALLEHLRTLGYEVEDLGAHELNSADDYPDYALALARKVAAEAGSRGILTCGTGEGEAMAANRVSGIRASVFYGPRRATEALNIEGDHSKDGFDIVRLARRHNNANVLCIGARFVSPTEADEAVRIFLETPFSTDPRHARRIAKF
jgi:ribose 5-phosphate isomerase B